jgi:hypothetical protein
MALRFQKEFEISRLKHLFSPTIGHQKRRNKNMSALWTLVHRIAQLLNRRSPRGAQRKFPCLWPLLYQPSGERTSNFSTPVQLRIQSNTTGLCSKTLK